MDDQQSLPKVGADRGSEGQEAKSVEGQKALSAVNLDRLFQDLSGALKAQEQRAARLISKLGDPTNPNKPSKQLLFRAFQALFDLLITVSQVESVTRGHTHSLTRTFAYQVRSVVRVLKNKGILTDEELRKATEEILAEDEKKMGDQRKQVLDESLKSAKEEAAKREKAKDVVPEVSQSEIPKAESKIIIPSGN